MNFYWPAWEDPTSYHSLVSGMNLFFIRNDWEIWEDIST